MLLTLGVALAAASRAGKQRNGLYLSGETLQLISWDEWMRFAPDAIKRAVHGGAINAEQIVAQVMRETFPERAWPPLIAAPLRSTYEELVAATEGLVFKPTDTRVGLRVVD